MKALRELARAAREIGEVPTPVERCELCSAPVGDSHDHLVDLHSRRLCCACRACALLFERPAAAEGRYRAVPDRVLSAEPTALSATDWAALRIPVSLTFLFFNSQIERWIAVYPSPAGAVESEPDPGALAAVREKTPLFDLAHPDVEALLARGRRGSDQLELLIVPVSAGYELVGRVRRKWRGFDGGDEARREIEAFFAGLHARKRLVSTEGGSP